MVFWGGNTLRPGERWYFAGENVVLGGVNCPCGGRKQIFCGEKWSFVGESMGFGVEKWYFVGRKIRFWGEDVQRRGEKWSPGKAVFVFGEESGTLREKLSCGLGGEQYSVAENAMFLGDKRVYLRRRRRAFGEKHRIRSQKDRMAWVEKDLKDHGVFNAAG